MPSVIKYSLFVLADLAIIGFIIHFGYSTLTVQGSIALERSARRRKFPTRFDKLKEGSYYVAVFLSLGLALYGVLVFLFSWMPHQWVSYDEDGDRPMWMAANLAGIGAFFGAVALMSFLMKTHGQFLELHRLQQRQAKADAFDKLLNYELTQIRLMLQRSGGLDADVPVWIERAIDKAEKDHTIFDEDAEVCRDLLNIFRMARAAPLPAKSL
jgi:hypothetical protein